MTGQAKPQRNFESADPALQRPEDLEFLEALERAIEATIRLQDPPGPAPQQESAQEPEGIAEPEPAIEPEPSLEPARFTEPSADSPDLAPLSTAPAPLRRLMAERMQDPMSPLLRGGARLEPPAVDERSRREAAIEILRQRRRPEPDEFMAPPQRRRWNGVAVASRLMLAAGVVTSVGFVIYHFITVVPEASDHAADGSVRTSVVGRAPADHQPAGQPVRRLVLTELSGAANRPVALGVTVQGPPQGAVVLVRGLPANSRITAGAPANDGAWRIPAQDLARAVVVPPPDYIGILNLSVDLTLADGSVADSDVLRLRWTATAPEAITPKPVRTTTIAPDAGIFPAAQAAPTVPAAPATAPVAAAPPAPPIPSTPPAAERNAAPPPPAPSPQPAQAPVRQVDQEELAMLLQRSETFLANGDISTARLLLRRAAEAGDLRATLALARTYDPVVLKQIGALGAKDDVAQARAWYQKASELGSAEAVMRLQRLAQETR